tara:strand:+ start:1755 stop:1946 length:192 start_codon:yes stop_codon:yes gene_type:complete
MKKISYLGKLLPAIALLFGGFLLQKTVTVEEAQAQHHMTRDSSNWCESSGTDCVKLKTIIIHK